MYIVMYIPQEFGPFIFYVRLERSVVSLMNLHVNNSLNVLGSMQQPVRVAQGVEQGKTGSVGVTFVKEELPIHFV